jgi:hypothetical protein
MWNTLTQKSYSLLIIFKIINFYKIKLNVYSLILWYSNVNLGDVCLLTIQNKSFDKQIEN